MNLNKETIVATDVSSLLLLAIGSPVEVVGRIVALRQHAKTVFADLRDAGHRVQLLFERADNLAIPELGDVVLVGGELGTSRTGEMSIKVAKWVTQAKCQIDLPLKTGVPDRLDRHGYRHLQLINNPGHLRALARAAEWQYQVRRILHDSGFVEVVTSVLQSRFNAGYANPFVTEVKASGEKRYLRLTAEMQHKKMLAAGQPRVFEMAKSFRNGGADTRHAPEFTLLEWYALGSSLEELLAFCERLVTDSIMNAYGTLRFEEADYVSDFTGPWARVSVAELGQDYFGSRFQLTVGRSELIELMKSCAVADRFNFNRATGQLWWDLLRKLLLPQLQQPTLVTDFPNSISPLAMASSEVEGASAKAALVVRGHRVADLMIDDNDATSVRAKLEAQSASTQRALDETFLHALQCGLPTTQSCGLAVERLLLACTPGLGLTDVRDMMPFPPD